MRKVITSTNFWTILQTLVDLIIPFESAMEALQADAPISIVWKTWTEVQFFPIYSFILGRESLFRKHAQSFFSGPESLCERET